MQNKSIDEIKLLLGNLSINQNRLKKSKRLKDHEFKVFSQWGDDGIIQFLIDNSKIINPFFIEFGVEDYSESNTRFLLINNNWSGLVMDGSEENIQRIMQQEYYWKYDLQAVKAWITKENINTLLQIAMAEDIGILSIDLDGNDYWVWQELDLKKLRPTIVILEYNSVFGPDRSISTPYKTDFFRTDEHHSNLYFGASLSALVDLSRKKGYVFVGCNSNGNNAFFIKKDRIGSLKSVSVKNGYVRSKFRESRDERGQLTYLRGEDRLKEISGLPVINTITGKLEKL